jgi:hypothetical protein
MVPDRCDSEAAIPAELLASPTLGAIRRARGITGWPVEGRHAFAVAVAEEARRRLVIDRLDETLRFLTAGGTVDQAAGQIARLAADLRPQHREDAAA